MGKGYDEFIEDIEELEWADKIAMIDALGVVHNVRVESINEDTIEFSDGTEQEKEELQKHIDDFEDDDDRGIKYMGNQYN